MYIYVLDSARLLFEHPVLQYKAIFARIFLYVLVWEAYVEYFDKNILGGWLYGQPLLEYFGYERVLSQPHVLQFSYFG